jgi:hypothetical protein
MFTSSADAPYLGHQANLMKNRKLYSFLLFVSLALVSHTYAWERVFDFDKDPLLNPPKGLVVETPPRSKPLVSVQEDKEAPSHPHVLSLRGSKFPGQNSLICLAWFTNFKNGEISVEFKHGVDDHHVTGKATRVLGFVWRYQSPGDTYSLEWNTQKGTLVLVSMIKERRKEIAKAKAVSPPDQWNSLRVNFQDSNIQCFVGDELLIESKYDGPAEAGKVGILLQSDAVVVIDNFKIKSDE